MMRQKRLGFILLCTFLLVGVGACTFPDFSSPTPFVFPTPNLTLTAIYSPTETVPPTVTPPPIQTTTPVPASPTLEISPTLPGSTPTEATAQTPTPTTSAGGVPDQRPGVSIPAEFLSSPPTIDGDLGEWSLSSYPVDRVVYGSGNVTGAVDLSGTVMAAWDEDNLYLGARVVDDRFVQLSRGINLFKGDSVEVLLDTKLAVDYFVRQLSPDDFQLGISPGSQTPGDSSEAYLWYPTFLAGSRSQVKIGSKTTSDGYTVEAAIPWSVFEVDPDIGKHFGFAFSISDNDLTGQVVQQSMASTISTRRLTDPTTWGDLTLEGP